ncbi:hypothetical protein MLD38_038425 [Melastoma candidum]|uniref:Uncharacterized protein n=1 Tax=Melastoma candidum TaxID=119954 RepID=A0ACB9L022_9MYRT|nr:hypothetical protein MLD38_038425 [Melastoma candidum]
MVPRRPMSSRIRELLLLVVAVLMMKSGEETREVRAEWKGSAGISTGEEEDSQLRLLYMEEYPSIVKNPVSKKDQTLGGCSGRKDSGGSDDEEQGGDEEEDDDDDGSLCGGMGL